MSGPPYQERSMLDMLLAKLAATKEVEAKTGVSTRAAQDEVLRQINEIRGDLIRGTRITKSGKED